MKLQQIIQNGTQNPIAHKTWPIGEHIVFRSGRWLKISADSRAMMETFEINSVDPQDDGFFILPDKRPTYEELVLQFCPDSTNVVIHVDGGIVQDVYANTAHLNVDVVDFDNLEEEGMCKDDMNEELLTLIQGTGAFNKVY